MRIADVLSIKGREVIKTSAIEPAVNAAQALSRHRIDEKEADVLLEISRMRA